MMLTVTEFGRIAFKYFLRQIFFINTNLLYNFKKSKCWLLTLWVQEGGKLALPQEPRCRATFPRQALHKRIKAQLLQWHRSCHHDGLIVTTTPQLSQQHHGCHNNITVVTTTSQLSLQRHSYTNNNTVVTMTTQFSYCCPCFRNFVKVVTETVVTMTS